MRFLHGGAFSNMALQGQTLILVKNSSNPSYYVNDKS